MEYLGIFDYESRFVFQSDTAGDLDKETLIGEFAWLVVAREPDSTPELVEQLKNMHQAIVRDQSAPPIWTSDWRDWHYRIRTTWLGLPSAAYSMQSIEFPRSMSLLTKRESEILRSYGDTGSVKETAEEEMIAVPTVHSHLQKIKVKMDLDSASLVTIAAKFARAH